MKTSLKALLGVLPLLAAAIFVLAPPASAAALQEVTSFGSNPSSLRMYVYVPDNVAQRPAIVVAVHYCHGDGPAFYNGSDFARLAEQYGYIVIYPSVTLASDGCFDVASSAALTRGGGSDPVGIMSMVTYAQQHLNGDPDRVFVTGVSSGAMMTNVLLGLYPDVFKAGSAFAGVPFGCFAGPNSWNNDCATGVISKTAQEWGDQVRAAYPGYTGVRPRVQLWHGTDDTVLHYNNFAEAIKQWTNVHGVSQTPTSTDNPQPTWTRTRYGSGTTKVEAISMQGVPHNLPVQAAEAIKFFGLDTTPTPGPTTSGPSTPAPTTPVPTTPVPTTPVPTTPVPTSPAAGGACRVTYTMNSWSSGFTAGATITNTGGSAVNGWSLVFTLPGGQAITAGWNASYAPASGQVTATNVSYNAAIAPNAAVGIGFQGTHTGNTAKPSSFTLNGVACTTA